MNWKSAWNYFRLSPSLWRAMRPGYSWNYMGHSLRRLFPGDPVHRFFDLIPARFYDDLTAAGFSYPGDHLWMLYCLVRYYRPEIMIETGVGQGASTAFILMAMHQNQSGHLYSIDLPPIMNAVETKIYRNRIFCRLEDGQGNWMNSFQIGEWVPEWLKDRWHLITGKAEIELPALIRRLSSIDLFYHDSLHTESYMTAEFQTVWSAIRPGGVLISHDILLNNAFYNFSRRHKIKPIIHRSFGVLVKPH